jgi:membrane fusion protein, multidrug efflux system
MMKFRNILILLTFVLYACSGDKPATPQNQVVEVTVLTVEPRDVSITFEFVSRTQSSHLVNIQARVSGFLDNQVYKEGAFVKKGDILFVLDKKPFQVQVDAAQAALDRQNAAMENAKLNLARVKPLVEQNALSQKDLDDAKSNFETSSASVEEAKAKLETAQLNLSYCTIFSPIDGITSAALKQEGSYVDVADSRLTTVSALSPIWVNFSLSDYQLQKFRNQKAENHLLLPQNDEYVIKVIQSDDSLFPYQGKITFSDPSYNIDTGTFLIRATVDNPQSVLRPNQYVTVKVEGVKRPNALLVPQRAVQQSAKGSYVWVVNQENKVEFRPVTAGDWHESDWFINEGLHPGERVVVDGNLKLLPGALVKIKEKL